MKAQYQLRKRGMTMKKMISTILVCVMLVGCVFTLASCTGPNSDPDKAEASLKEAGYTVIAIPTFGIAGVKKSYLLPT